MEEYLINKDTYAIIATYTGTKIIDKNGISFYDEKTRVVVNRSCKYYGSSLNGRLEGSRDILGITYKAPIIVSENNRIVLIPTTSVRADDCSWISLYSIASYYQKNEKQVEITFKNDRKLLLNLSYGIIDKQIMRASRLDNIVRARKELFSLD